MEKGLIETAIARKAFSNPQLKVVALKSADVINTSNESNESYEDGDTSDWYPTNP